MTDPALGVSPFAISSKGRFVACKNVSRRTERLASIIQQELGMMILSELNDPRVTGMPSITRVKVAEDLSVADVFVTIMGTAGQQSMVLNALKHSAGLMRGKLTKALTLRTVPFIKFHLDEGIKKEIAILELLRKVSEENAELDRQRAQGGPMQSNPLQSDPAPSNPAEPHPAPSDPDATEARKS